MNKALSFKELEEKLHEADEVLNQLKKLKADKDNKNKDTIKAINDKDKIPNEKLKKLDIDINKNLNENTEIKNDKESGKKQNKIFAEEKGNSTKLNDLPKNNLKSSNSTISKSHTQINKDSNQNFEMIDVTKKLSETMAPFENELKKLLNLNSFGNNFILKFNKTNEQDDSNKNNKIGDDGNVKIDKNEIESKEKENKENEVSSINSKERKSNVITVIKSKEKENKENEVYSDTKNEKKSIEKTESTENKLIESQQETPSSFDNLNQNSKPSNKNQNEKIKLVKELNQELKQDAMTFKNNFLKEFKTKSHNLEDKYHSSKTLNSENISNISAIPNKIHRPPKKNLNLREKKITIDDLNNLKKNLSNENSEETTQFSMIEKRISKKTDNNESILNRSNEIISSSLAESMILENGNLKFPDGPLDLPFFM